MNSQSNTMKRANSAITCGRAANDQRRLRTAVETEIERLISLLDHLDGDADFEEQHDAEPEETDQNGDEGDFDGGEHDFPGHIPGGQGL